MPRDATSTVSQLERSDLPTRRCRPYVSALRSEVRLPHAQAAIPLPLPRRTDRQVGIWLCNNGSTS